MKKIERLEREAQKAREKIAAMQALLKDIDGKRTEQEDLQIIKRIRALNLTRDELYAFMSSGALPASLAGAIADPTDPDTTAEPETIYTRRDKNKKRNKNAPDSETQEGESTADTANSADTTDPNNEAINYESEDLTHEG